MKKIISAVLFISLFLSLAPFSFAENLCPNNEFNPLCGNIQIGTMLSAFISFIFVISVVVALLYLIWGGFKWLTSGGDKTAVGAAREHIVAAIVGLILIFMSYFILSLLIRFFIPNFNFKSFNIPTINGTSSSGSSSSQCNPQCTGGHVCINGSCSGQ